MSDALLVGLLTFLGTAFAAWTALGGKRVDSHTSLTTAGIASTSKFEEVTVEKLFARVNAVEEYANNRVRMVEESSQRREDATTKRLEKVEGSLAHANAANDGLQTKNSDLYATNIMQAAQIAQLQSDVANHKIISEERDSLRRELAEARSEIALLRREIAQLRNPNLTNIQGG